MGGTVPPHAPPCKDGRPVKRSAECIELAKGTQQNGSLLFVPPQRRHDLDFLATLLVALRDGGGQDRVRTQLHHGIATHRQQMPDAAGETNRLPDIVPPVVRTQLRPLHPEARDRGEERQSGRPGLDALQRLEQLLADRVHLGAVEGVLDLQEAAEDLLLFQDPGDFFKSVGLSRKGDGRGTVDGGDADPARHGPRISR